jgi:DNA-binding CsgD family transcriptional regulator
MADVIGHGSILARPTRAANPIKLGSLPVPGVILTGMGERKRSRARERLAALAEATLDGEEARREAIGILRRAIGFERWCWPLTDPTSALATGGIAEFDLWPSLPRIAVLEEHGDITSKPGLVLGRRASVALSAATDGDLARSRRWRECLAPYGVGDELMGVCRDRHGCWGSVELMRDSDDAAFEEEDVRLLHELAPTLGALLRRSRLHDAWADREAPRPLPAATLIVDANLRPAGRTPAFGDWLAELPPGGAGDEAEMLPPAVYEIATRVLTPPDAANGLPASVRIRTPTGRRAVLEGAPLEGAEGGGVAITVRTATAEEVFDLRCKAHDLTRRERQLAALMLGGLATRQLAEALCISPYTVQDHLKGIFAKTGVRSRRELTAHLAGRLP